MDTKLTLRLNESVIKRAKVYARNHNVSLSKVVESYLDNITKAENGEEVEISPLIESLSGVINLPEDYDYKSDYKDYLNEKYN